MEKIKPCPFCGAEARMYSGTTYRFDSGHGWVCACKACDAQGEIGETEEEAVRNWNRRVVNIDALLGIADEIEEPWPSDVEIDGAIPLEELTSFEHAIADRIRKAVGE